MTLPKSLLWIEADLPEILVEKERLLAGETPTCQLERVKLDLSHIEARRTLFRQVASRANRVLVVSEGLLIYLMPEQVAALAHELAVSRYQDWVTDLVSPGLLKILISRYPRHVRKIAPFHFGPAEGPLFFEPHGWKPVEVHSLSKTADRHGRLSYPIKLLRFLPESTGRQGLRPWGGVCWLQRRQPT
jgi:O-methyltransferase involved in polyketide biosynthesis